MAIRLLGNRQDAIAFGLAGLETVECRNRAEVIAAFDDARADPHVALVIVSPAAAALGPDVVAHMRDAVAMPMTVLLPDTGDKAAA